MAERTRIPGTPACGEWETQLADALDGLLKPEEEARFEAHKADCLACAGLYEAARKGREWLEFLSPEPEPPAGLLEKILATTGPGKGLGTAVSGMPVPVAAGGAPAFMPPVWQQQGFVARMRSSAQPRLLMTAAMAFFSIALTLNLAGVRVANLRASNLRPRAMRSYMERQLMMASVPVVRYYDHLRFVYEVEARVRELRGQDDDKGNGGDGQQQTQPVTPGESREIRDRGNKGTREQESKGAGERSCPAGNERTGASGNFLEASLKFPMKAIEAGGHTIGQSKSYVVQTLRGGTPWIA